MENTNISSIAKELKLNPATVTKVLKINNIPIKSFRDYERPKLKRDNKGRFEKRK